ncbi:MAG: response regulator transcription factor [Pseudomonadota bacterium]
MWTPFVVSPGSGLLGSLSKREVEVARLYAAGLSHKEAARQLCIACNTVRVHLHKVFKKLAIHSRGELRMRLQPASLSTNSSATTNANRRRDDAGPR